MPEDLDGALAGLRELLLGPDLVRAIAAGRRRGGAASVDGPQTPTRAELRLVALRDGANLQIVTTHQHGPTTRNLPVGSEAAGDAVDALLGQPFANWHVETGEQIRQLRVTKRGQAQVHLTRTSRREVRPSGHDRPAQHLLAPDDELFAVLGAGGDKRRQVDAFLRQLVATIEGPARAAAAQQRPLRVVDLGCGNAYLTFAAHRYLAAHCEQWGLSAVLTVGVDSRPDMVERNRALAGRLAPDGPSGLSFQASSIAEAVLAPSEVDVVLALHACDTATDDALARAVRWRAGAILAAPCCHHDIQRQVLAGRRAGQPPPQPYGAVLRHAILRERLADVLTDAFRAEVLRLLGFRVDVVEFVDSRHTPRNALLRAVQVAAAPTAAQRDELVALVAAWHVEPALMADLAPELDEAMRSADLEPLLIPVIPV